MSCNCGGKTRARATGRIVGMSAGANPRVIVERADGRHVSVDASRVSADELRAFALRVGLPIPAGMAGLGDLGDDFAQLVTEMQRLGRGWFFERIRELSGLGVGLQGLAVRTDALGRPDFSRSLRERAGEMADVGDALYWIVDTYLGGVDALPNVVPVPGGSRLGAANANRVRTTARLAPVLLAAALKGLGIVSAAALLAYISSVAAEYAVRVRQVEAAETNNNPSLLPTPEKGVIEQTTDLVGRVTLIGLLALAWINRDRILGAARRVGRRGAES